jgi:hypothetical protein
MEGALSIGSQGSAGDKTPRLKVVGDLDTK